MAEGRGKFEWGIASSMMALVANAHRDSRRGQPARPSDFNPFAPRAAKPVLRGREMLAALRAAFIRGEGASAAAASPRG